MIDVDSLADRIGYAFRNPELLGQALTHSSRTHENPDLGDNQRMEFLGDAVLGLVLAEALYSEYPDEREGHLAQARSVLAKGAFLAKLARKIGLPEQLRMSEAEHSQDGHQRDAALEDALEALIGAIYLDSDYPTTRACVLDWYGDLRSGLIQRLQHDNPKGRLQEWTQANAIAPSQYTIVRESGPGHAREFEAEVRVPDRVDGFGVGSSKKEAEEEAARDALAKLPAG